MVVPAQLRGNGRLCSLHLVCLAGELVAQSDRCCVRKTAPYNPVRSLSQSSLGHTLDPYNPVRSLSQSSLGHTLDPCNPVHSLSQSSLGHTLDPCNPVHSLSLCNLVRTAQSVHMRGRARLE